MGAINYYATIGPIALPISCTYYDAYPRSVCLRDAVEPTLKVCAKHFRWMVIDPQTGELWRRADY